MGLAGIKDVADLAGLSIATVSRALSGKANVSPKSRQLAQAAAEELGFVPSYHASSLASGRNHNVGLVLPSVHRWYFSSVVEGVSATLLDAGYDLTLYNVGFQQPERRRSVLNDFLLRKRLDAVIAVALVLSEAEIARLLAIHRPIVGIGGALAGASTIRIDDAGLSRMAAEHLIRLGHTCVAHMTGYAELNQDFKLPGIRQSGFEAAMKAAGLGVRPEWQVSADFTIQGAYASARKLLGTAARPTAVFAASDEMAIGIILAARDYGLRVPHDLSVIGMDGHELGEVFGLTTINQDARGQGSLAAQLLLERLDVGAIQAGKQGGAKRSSAVPATVDLEYPTEFVIRTSTAVPPAGA